MRYGSNPGTWSYTNPSRESHKEELFEKINLTCRSSSQRHTVHPSPAVASMAPPNDRILVAPNAPQHILDLCRAASQQSPKPPKGPKPSTARPTGRGEAKPGARRPLTERRRRRRNSSTSSIGTLFSGERVGGHLQRGSAVIFRPHRSKLPPHERPIFVVKDNGVDAKDCMDITNPKRFSSIERSMTLRGIRHLNPLLHSAPSSRPNSVASNCSSPVPDYAAWPAFRPSQGA